MSPGCSSDPESLATLQATEAPTRDLHVEAQFFEANREALMRRYAGKVLVIRGPKVVAVYENPVVARREADKEFRSGTYLIQQIARAPATRR